MRRHRPAGCSRGGFTLIDTCVALALSSLLALAAAGVMAHVAALRGSIEPALQGRTSGRAAMAWLGDQIRQAGALAPPPTVDSQNAMPPTLRPALSADSIGVAGDRLTLFHESRSDCLGNARVGGRLYFDAARKPVALTQANSIYVSRTATGGPSLMCDPDGPGTASAQAFAAQIEAMQLRFWLRGGAAWLSPAAVTTWDTVQAVEVCLVLSGERLSACPSGNGSGPRSPRVVVGAFALRNPA